jgi:hypothetical protein
VPLTNIAATPTLDELTRQAPPTPAANPPISFFDSVKLGYKADQARPSWGFNETNWKNGAIAEVEDALRKKGVAPSVDLMNPGDAIGRGIRPGESYADAENRLYGELFAQVAKVRASDPKVLPDYAAVVDKRSFDEYVRGRQKAQLESVDRKAPDGLGFGGFIGGLAHGSLDPINFLPVGGEVTRTASVGRNILLNGLRWGAVNAGVTVATEPLVREHAAELGIDRTNGDFALDVLGAATLGGLLGGPGAELARFGKDKLVGLLKRPRAADAAPTGSDAHVAEIFSDLVPEGERTPDEQAAVHAIERDAEVKAASSFVPGPEGDDAHADWLGQAMQALHEPDKLPQRGEAKPIDRATISAPADVDGTRMPARELVKAKIHSAEAPHGGPNLAGGNAYGPYQFEPQTWVSLFKRRYPNDKRSFDEIKNLRGDPHLNDVLINDLISENSAALRHAGFAENAGNLYLAHVLGHDRAVTVLRAGVDAKLGDLLPDNYFAKNPFRKTDSAASLVRWAYRKMGDESGVPVHIASDEASHAGAEAIGAGEGDPAVDVSTVGRFDVEALYGDIGMTDRPVLNPELFGSPEQHAAAQLRFERARDASDGFAPVMSRAEAFAPAEHFDALKAYKGKVTADAIGEALGLTPEEVQRAVGSMQSVDPNSPFVLTRGRPEKIDPVSGAVLRKGTEAGRVIRRPPKILKQNETMLEYLTRAGGGLNDVGGDIAHMGGHDWHKDGPFRRKLIDNEGGQSLDDAFQMAIDAGYFPEHAVAAETYDQLPDLQDFRDAIREELHGNPRHTVGDYAAVADAEMRARYGEEEEAAANERFPAIDGESAADRAERLFELTGHNQEAIAEAAHRSGIVITDDQMMIDASDLVDAGMEPGEALDHAVLGAIERDLQEFAALSGEMGYEPSDEFAAYIGEGPEERGDFGGDREDGLGGGRSAAAEGGEEASRDALAQSAHDPVAREFDDPVGKAAEAQADSAVHDLQMEAKPAEAAAQPDSTTYRLDEEGGESDLASILDEIEAAQKANDEMRGCIKPKGGDQ